MSRIPYLTAEELSDERRLAAKLAASRGGRLVGPGALAAQSSAGRAGRCLAPPHGAPHLPAQTPVGTGDPREPPLYSVATPGAGMRRRRHELVSIVP